MALESVYMVHILSWITRGYSTWPKSYGFLGTQIRVLKDRVGTWRNADSEAPLIQSSPTWKKYLSRLEWRSPTCFFSQPGAQNTSPASETISSNLWRSRLKSRLAALGRHVTDPGKGNTLYMFIYIYIDIGTSIYRSTYIYIFYIPMCVDIFCFYMHTRITFCMYVYIYIYVYAYACCQNHFKPYSRYLILQLS